MINVRLFCIYMIGAITTYQAVNSSAEVPKLSILGDKGMPVSNDKDIHLGRFADVLYKGKWTSKQDKQNNFILDKEGSMLAAFGDMTEDEKKLDFQFLFYQGYYIEDRYIVTHFNLTLTDDNQSDLAGESDKAKVVKVAGLFSRYGTDECPLSGEIHLTDSNGKPMHITTNNIQDLYIKGNVQSTKCDLSIDFDVSLVSIELLSVNGFILLQICAIILGLYPFYKAFRDEDLSDVNNINDTAFLFNISIDMIMISINMTFSMRLISEYFEFLSLIMMFMFINFIFKLRTYLYLFESRALGMNLDNEQLSRMKFNFILKFLAISIVCNIFANSLIVYYKFFLLLALYPIFQIIHNSYNVIRKNCFKFRMHALFVFPQFIYVLGFRSFNFTFFQLRQDYKFGIILASILIAQLLVMYGQKLFGPAFYLPRFLVPNYYEYMRKLKNLDNAETYNCPICFMNLTEMPEHDSRFETKLLPSKYMETPCGHKFHESCLKSWMEQKLICPCCRTAVPPY